MSKTVDALLELKEDVLLICNRLTIVEYNYISNLFEKAIAEQQALPDREAELMAEIERLKRMEYENNNTIQAAMTLATMRLLKRQKLQQQLSSLKQKVSEHNDACLQGCVKTSGDNHCGYAGYDRDCTTCPKDHMIDMGEHHDNLFINV